MPTITPLKIAKECFDTLTNLYEKKAPSQKRVLKKRLRTLKMNKDEGVGPFFTKIAQVRDQLTAIGITMDDDDLVQTVFDGFPNSWETFLAAISGRENQPNFDRLWHDAWKKKEEFRTRLLALRKETLLLQLRQGSSRIPPLRKGRERNHKVNTLMF